MLKNEAWQAISGTHAVEIYPFIIKPSIDSSNAFLISTDNYIILIDTGALSAQMERIKSEIKQLLWQKARPVLIFLTHCHADHCLQAFNNTDLSKITEVRVAIQENGVQPLEEKDERRTIADIERKVLPDAKIDLKLLSRHDRENPGERILNLGNGIRLETIVEKVDTGNNPDFYRQIIMVAPDVVMEIYPMPGHSPDSICIRIGDILFAGDFFFAINYLIAGSIGWNREQMLESIQQMLWLVRATDLNLFCTGHGNPLSRTKAIENMYSMLEKTSAMTNLSEINCGHMIESSNYAIELLEELNDTMAIIAGRLYRVVYYLDFLGESAQSEKYAEILDFKKIEELLEEYSDFASLFNSGSIAYPTLIMKAAQLTGKIDKIFAGDIDGIIDKCLFQRVQRSYQDFIQITSGMPINYTGEILDLNRIIEDLLQQITSVPYNDNILEVLNSDEQYIKALVSRIAFQPVFKNVLFDFQPYPGQLMVNINKDRFCDALLGILEEIAAIDIKQIRIVSARANNRTIIRIDNHRGIPGDVLSEKKLQLYQRKFAVLGGSLELEKDQDHITLIINCH
ncbi:MAG: MBL fold metallo-hydrolase [Syntrophomonas sp.]